MESPREGAQTQKQSILPKPTIMRIAESFMEFYDAIHRTGRIPSSLMSLLAAVLSINMSFSCLLPLAIDQWPADSKFGNLLYILTFLWRFDTNRFTDANYKLQALLVLLFNLGSFVFIATYFFVYWHYKYLSPTSATIVLTWINFCQTYLSILIGTPLATLLYNLITNSSARTDPGVYAYFIVLTIIVTYTLVLFLAMAYNRVIYDEGQTITWSGIDHSLLFFITFFLSFFTRSAEVSSGYYRIVTSFIAFAIEVYNVAIGFIRPVFIVKKRNCVFYGFCAAGAVIMLMNAISFCVGTYISRQVITITFLVLALIFAFLYAIYFQKIEAKSVNLIEQFESDPSRFDELFSRESTFLRTYRIGFQMGHTSLKPAMLSIEKWNSSPDVWMQTIRFAAVYYSDNSTLISLSDQFRKKFKSNIVCWLFSKVVTAMIKGRIQATGHEVSSSLKSIHTLRMNLESTMKSYWKAIEKQQKEDALYFAIKGRKEAEWITTQFNGLLSSFPNKPIVYSQYAEFLEKSLCDHKKADYMQKQTNLFSNEEEYYIDRAEEAALNIFKRIPRGKSFPKPEEDSNRGEIYEIAKSVHVKQICLMVTAFIVMLCIPCLILLFSPSIAASLEHNRVEKMYKGFLSVEYLGESFSKASSFLYLEALRQIGSFPSPNSLMFEYEGTNSSATYISYIETAISSADTYASDFVEQMGDEIPFSSDFGSKLRKTSLSLKEADGSIVNETVESSVTTLMSYYHKYTTSISFSSNWLLEIVYNSRSVSEILLNAAELAISDLYDLISDGDSVIFATCLVSGLLSAAIYGLSLLALRDYYRMWDYFVRSFKTLPRNSIRHIISKTDEETEETDFNTSEKPKSIGAYFACLAVIAIACLSTINAVIHSTEQIMVATAANVFTKCSAENSLLSLLNDVILSLSSSVANISGWNNTLNSSITSAESGFEGYFSSVYSKQNGGILSETIETIDVNSSYSALFLTQLAYASLIDAAASPNSSSTSLSVYTLSLKLLPKLFEYYQTQSATKMYTTVTKVSMISYIIPLGGFIFALICGSFGLKRISNTNKGIKFAIKTIAALKHAEVMASESLTSVLGGDFSKETEENDFVAKRDVLDEVLKRVDDGVIVIDTDLILTFVNEKAKSMFGHCLIGSSIRTFLRFSSEDPLNDIQNALQNKPEGNAVGEYKIEVGCLTSEENRRMNVRAFVLSTSNKLGSTKKGVFTFTEEAKVIKSAENDEQKKISEIKLTSVPKRLRKWFEKDTQRISCSNVIIGVIHAKSASAQKFKELIGTLSVCLDGTEDGVLIRVFGKSAVFAMNSIVNSTNLKKLFQDSMEFVTHLSKESSKIGVTFNCSFGLSRNSIMGTLGGDFTDFHIFSRAVQMAHIAASLAKEGTLLIPKDIYDQLSADYVSKIKLVQLQHPLFKGRDQFQLDLTEWGSA